MSWDGYRTERWRRLRKRILRRDGYLCREAARYGKRVEATIVHHVWPAEDYPEYAWEAWNLISLSVDGHKAMHDPFSGKLTDIGERWRRRSPPPSTPSRESAFDSPVPLYPTAEEKRGGVVEQAGAQDGRELTPG